MVEQGDPQRRPGYAGTLPSSYARCARAHSGNGPSRPPRCAVPRPRETPRLKHSRSQRWQKSILQAVPAPARPGAGRSVRGSAAVSSPAGTAGGEARGMSPPGPSRPACLAPEAPLPPRPFLVGLPTLRAGATREVSICFMGLHPLILFCHWKSDSHLPWSV